MIRIEIPVSVKKDEQIGMLAWLLPNLLRLVGIRTKAKLSFVPDGLPEE